MPSEPILETYRGHQIEYQFDLDWHVIIDGSRRGMFMTLEAAERRARADIDQMEKDKA